MWREAEIDCGREKAGFLVGRAGLVEMVMAGNQLSLDSGVSVTFAAFFAGAFLAAFLAGAFLAAAFFTAGSALLAGSSFFTAFLTVALGRIPPSLACSFLRFR